MPAIANRKKETFARLCAEGHDLATAMRRSGLGPDRRNGTRYRKHPAIAARIAELVAIRESKSAATIASMPAPPDRSGVDDDLERAAWRAHDDARSAGDARGVRTALALVAKARTARPRRATEDAGEAPPPPRHPWRPERVGLPADAPPTALGTLITLVMEGPDAVIREREEDAREERMRKDARAWSDREMVKHQARVAAAVTLDDASPEQRVAWLESRRRRPA